MDIMILTAEQAAALPGPFVIDGYDMTVQDCEGYALNGPMNRAPGPPPPWSDLDQPCPTCGGQNCSSPRGLPFGAICTEPSHDCSDCYGTGRRVVELETATQTEVDAYETDSLGLFTVNVQSYISGSILCDDQYRIAATKVET